MKKLNVTEIANFYQKAGEHLQAIDLAQNSYARFLKSFLIDNELVEDLEEAYVEEQALLSETASDYVYTPRSDEVLECLVFPAVRRGLDSLVMRCLLIGYTSTSTSKVVSSNPYQLFVET
jgi:hypothetical protein